MERGKSTQKVFYSENEEPIILSKALLDTLLKQEYASDLIALYSFYYYTAKWQKTNQPRATTEYTASGLKWTTKKVRKLKGLLSDLHLIEDIISRDNGKLTGHYIKVNFIWSQHHIDKSPPSRVDHSVVFSEGNALSSNNKLFSSKNSLEYITPQLFELFWKQYPRKVNKGNALSSWNKLCKKGKDRPIWLEIRKALHYQIKSEQWQYSIDQIPHASTWLNNNRWLNDANLMKPFIEKEQKKLVCPCRWEFGIDFSDEKIGCQNCEDSDRTHGVYLECKKTYKLSKKKK